MDGQLITKQMIENYTKDKPMVMVVIYANWCGHCRAMKQELGSKMVNSNDLIFLEDSQIADDLKDFYPHIHIYRYGQDSTAEMADLLKFVKNKY